MNKAILGTFLLLVVLLVVGFLWLATKPTILVTNPKSEQRQGEETVGFDEEEGESAIVNKKAPVSVFVPTSDDDFVRRAFAEKYNRPIEEVNASISERIDDYAKGGVSFEGEMGGGWFLAAMEDGDWIIVADGNGTVACEDIEPYNFPVGLVPQCWQESTGELITR